MIEDSQSHGSVKNIVVVIGNSMYPTLKHLDLVYVTSCDGRTVRVGDVIVYNPPCDCKKVVHRIIATSPDGIRTQGDGLTSPDYWVIDYDSVVGKVKLAQCGNRKRPVYNGIVGRLIGHVNHVYARLRGFVKYTFWRVYRFAYRTGIFRALLPRSMKPRILSFRKPEGEELQLLMGKWAVGTRHAGKNDWKIKPPFRLFIDESILVTQDEEQCEAGVCRNDTRR